MIGGGVRDREGGGGGVVGERGRGFRLNFKDLAFTRRRASCWGWYASQTSVSAFSGGFGGRRRVWCGVRGPIACFVGLRFSGGAGGGRPKRGAKCASRKGSVGARCGQKSIKHGSNVHQKNKNAPLQRKESLRDRKRDGKLVCWNLAEPHPYFGGN